MKEYSFEVPYSIDEYAKIIKANAQDFTDRMYHNQEGLFYCTVNTDKKKISAYISADSTDNTKKKESSLVFHGKMQELPGGGINVKGRFWYPWTNYAWFYIIIWNLIYFNPFTNTETYRIILFGLFSVLFIYWLILGLRTPKPIKERNNEILERLLIPEQMIYKYMEVV